MQIPGGTRVIAMELVASLTANATGNNAVGSVLSTVEVNPRELTGTLAFNYSGLYARYKPRRLRFVFVTAQPTTGAGQLIMGFNKDPASAPPPNSIEGARIMSAWDGSVSFPVWKDSQCVVNFAPDKPFYTDTTGSEDISMDMRLLYPGTFYVFVEQTLAVANNSPIGSVYMEYEMDFTDANLKDNLVGAFWTTSGNPSSTANAGWNQFTGGALIPLGDQTFQMVSSSGSGNVYMTVPEGQWILIQTFKCNTGTAGTSPRYASPSVLVNDQNLSASTVPMQTFVPVQQGGVYTSTRIELWTIPAGGGVFYGNFTATDGAATVTTTQIYMLNCSPALASSESLPPPTLLKQLSKQYYTHRAMIPKLLEGSEHIEWVKSELDRLHLEKLQHPPTRRFAPLNAPHQDTGRIPNEARMPPAIRRELPSRMESAPDLGAPSQFPRQQDIYSRDFGTANGYPSLNKGEGYGNTRSG